MSENLRWYTKALYGFDHVVRLAPAGSWDRPSPCEGWTARHVVGHVLAIQVGYAALIAGRERPMNPMVDPDRHSGADPAAAWANARDTVLEALDHHGVLQRSVVTPMRGEQVVDEMVGFNVLDTTIHSWDLARALGVDDRLDPGLVTRATAIAEPVMERYRAAGVFGPVVDLPAGADPQARLLALTGRRP